jgi:hypothetical protein
VDKGRTGIVNTLQAIVEGAKVLTQAMRVEIVSQIVSTLDLSHKRQVESAVKRRIEIQALQQ